MTQSLIAYSALLLFGTFVSAVSQVILKKAAMKHHASWLKEYLNFPVIFAYTLFILATLLSIFAYKVVPLSFGPVLESTSYLYVTVFGVLIFKEKMTKKKALGLALILIGIGIYALGIPSLG